MSQALGLGEVQKAAPGAQMTTIPSCVHVYSIKLEKINRKKIYLQLEGFKN
jgi:hypothetical protein